MPKKHSRPEKDFTITSLAWESDIEDQHHRAGFPPVPKSVLKRRFWQFIDFLQSHGMTVRPIVQSIEELPSDAQMRNSDLNEDGFYFVQRFHGRWLNRTRKDLGAEKEEAFLSKWWAQFRDGSRAVSDLPQATQSPNS